MSNTFMYVANGHTVAINYIYYSLPNTVEYMREYGTTAIIDTMLFHFEDKAHVVFAPCSTIG